MPWGYPDNVPSSMKYLKPSIQKKAIRISNAILENGGSEGVAIATGIKKAKELHSKVKTFNKTASLNWATDAAEAQSNVLHKTQSMNNSIIMPKLTKLRQPTSMNSNFAQIGKISA
jgi:uncharacterized protein YdaT